MKIPSLHEIHVNRKKLAFFLLAEYNIFKFTRFRNMREIRTKIVKKAKRRCRILNRIGTINLGNVEESCLMSDTCYMLSPQYWGRGIMTEVLYAVLNYAFHEIGFNRVQAEVFAGNAASEHVLAKCGMQYEGTARQKYFKNGLFIDAAQYAVLRQDFERRCILS